MGDDFGFDHCGPHKIYIEMTPQGVAWISFNFQGAVVSHAGDEFTVSRNGTVSSTFVVRNGYVVKETTIFPGTSSQGACEFVTEYTEIGHAPKIVVPSPTEVVPFPKFFFHGCPG